MNEFEKAKEELKNAIEDELIKLLNRKYFWHIFITVYTIAIILITYEFLDIRGMLK